MKRTNVNMTDFLFGLSTALDWVEAELLGINTNHSKRVALISTRICQKLQLPQADQIDMACCAILHDNALTEYMQHTDIEHIKRLENIQSHCEYGEEKVAQFPFMGDCKNVILWHHENWNGSGFYSLKANEIPSRAAALRIADNTDLLFSLETQTNQDDVAFHLEKEKAEAYSPEITDIFISILDKELLESLENENINAALTENIPKISQALSTEDLFHVANVFADIIDAKSPFTSSHSQGITEKVQIMSKYYNYDIDHTYSLMTAASLHDLGKLAVRNSLIEKKGALNDTEFINMKKHAQKTWEVLSHIHGFEEITHWASFHHEKLNGKGYPFGKKAQELDTESRLIACMDIYQALTEDRPYRAGLGHKKSMEIMRKMAELIEIDKDIVEDTDKVFKNISTA